MSDILITPITLKKKEISFYIHSMYLIIFFFKEEILSLFIFQCTVVLHSPIFLSWAMNDILLFVIYVVYRSIFFFTIFFNEIKENIDLVHLISTYVLQQSFIFYASMHRRLKLIFSVTTLYIAYTPTHFSFLVYYKDQCIIEYFIFE